MHVAWQYRTASLLDVVHGCCAPGAAAGLPGRAEDATVPRGKDGVRGTRTRPRPGAATGTRGQGAVSRRAGPVRNGRGLESLSVGNAERAEDCSSASRARPVLMPPLQETA